MSTFCNVLIDNIIDAYDNDSSKLVGILLEVQALMPEQYIPKEAAVYISKKLDLHLSRIYDVITFYAALSSEPRAKYVIQICDSVVCGVVGNSILKTTLEDVLGIKIGQKTADGLFALELSPCFGACDVAPAIRLNGKVFGGLTSKEKVRDILTCCIK